ncbi:hypothetical protein K8S19_10800 [bacterium]|nr:hypothetical protein [bacterium]
MMFFKKKSLLLFSLILILSSGCAHYNFRIIVQDVEDQPLSDAVVYVESYNQAGAVDFTWVQVSGSVTVPPENEAEIRLNGSNETFIAIAVLADGKKPVVMRDSTGVLKPEMWEYMAEDQLHTGLRWEPNVAKMGFPFMHHYALKERLKKKENWVLVHAFHRVYAPLGILVEKNQASRTEKETYVFFIEKVYNPVCALEAAERAGNLVEK